MCRVNAAARAAELVIIIIIALLIPATATAQTDTPTPDACATDAAERWATVLAYESPTVTATYTPTATATPYADVAVSAALVEPRPVVSDYVGIEIGLVNIGTAVLTDNFTIDVYQQTGPGMYNTQSKNWTMDLQAQQSILLNTYYQVVNAEMIYVKADVYDDNLSNNVVALDYYPANPTASPTPSATPAYITMTLPYSTTARVFMDANIAETSGIVVLVLSAVSILSVLGVSKVT